MTGAGATLTMRSDAAQSSSAKLRCAQFLDENKLRSLTKEPTKTSLYAFISEFYEEREFITINAGQKNKVTKLAIKQGRSSKELESLAKAFEAIGYFNVSDVLKGTATDVASKAKSTIFGLFSSEK